MDLGMMQGFRKGEKQPLACCYNKGMQDDASFHQSCERFAITE